MPRAARDDRRVRGAHRGPRSRHRFGNPRDRRGAPRHRSRPRRGRGPRRSQRRPRKRGAERRRRTHQLPGGRRSCRSFRASATRAGQLALGRAPPAGLLVRAPGHARWARGPRRRARCRSLERRGRAPPPWIRQRRGDVHRRMDDARAAAHALSVRRFTIASERIDGDRVAFDNEESRHMAAVLRLVPGDLVIAGDGRGRDYTVRLETLDATATGTIVGVAASRAESPLVVTLVQGIPKGDKMEQIVRAATELGVARVLPAITERTIVRLEPSRWRDRARRWQRVAKEAAKQSGRSVVPAVGTPRPLADCLDPEDAELAVCMWEGEAPALGDILASARSPRAVRMLIGPEGGLARSEVEAAKTRGWSIASAGPRILRTETAGPAIVAVLQFVFGDLSGIIKRDG